MNTQLNKTRANPKAKQIEHIFYINKKKKCLKMKKEKRKEEIIIKMLFRICEFLME